MKNQLITLPDSIAQLKSLTELYLSDNRINQIPESLKDLKQLRELSISSNPLDAVPEWIGEMTGLTKLWLYGTALTEVPSWIRKLSRLNVLNLANNQIEAIPEWIAELKGLTKLYLDQNRLTIFPDSIAQLKSLTGLYFSDNHLSQIPESLKELKQLRELSISSNPFDAVPEWIGEMEGLAKLWLYGIALTEVPDWVRKLKKLSYLSLSNNQIELLPEWIGELKDLSELHISQNQLTTLPDSFSQLKAMSTLDLWGNSFSTFPNVVLKLDQLITLDMDSNHLSSIPVHIGQLKFLEKFLLQDNLLQQLPIGLAKLPKLELLDISKNKLRQLPRQFFESNLAVSSNSSDRGLRLSGNPLESPPSELVEQGNEIVLSYFEEIELHEGQVEFLFEVKLLIIGDGNTGKTTFQRKIVDPRAKMPHKQDSTLGIDVSQWSFSTDYDKRGKNSKVQFHVNLWDLGGQNLYRGTHQIFFSEKSYYVLLADSRREHTDFRYWLNTVKQLGGEDSRVLIVLNEVSGRPVKFDERGIRGHFGELIHDVIALDLKNDTTKIRDLQETLALRIKQLSGISDELPSRWVRIRDTLSLEKKNYISFDRFQDICRTHGANYPELVRVLSKYFDRIGVITHFISDPILQDRVYLNSNWLLKIVYKILDNTLIKRRDGRINRSDILKIWQEEVVEFEYDRLIQIMNKFGLMYRIPETDEYVVPAHLPGAQPYEQWLYQDESNLLFFRYEF